MRYSNNFDLNLFKLEHTTLTLIAKNNIEILKKPDKTWYQDFGDF